MEDSNGSINPSGELQELQYHWYVLGCAHLGWSPLPKADFWKLYELLHRCERVVCAYRQKSENKEFALEQDLSESLRLSNMLDNIKREINRLCVIDRAVLTGKRLDRDDGAAIGARLQPVPPNLTGTAARQLPYMETESDIRNSWPE